MTTGVADANEKAMLKLLWFYAWKGHFAEIQVEWRSWVFYWISWADQILEGSSYKKKCKQNQYIFMWRSNHEKKCTANILTLSLTEAELIVATSNA